MLEFIIREREKRFTLQDKRYAKGLLNALQGLIEHFCDISITAGFYMFSKGTGVICADSNGIKANELIVPYFGEIYSPARWLDKQDIIKSLLSSYKEYSKELPDCHNHWLERHAEDPEGYDLLMVDHIYSRAHSGIE